MAACYAAIRIIQRKRRREQLLKKILKDFQNPFSLEESIFKEKFCFNQTAVQFVHDLISPVMRRHLGYPVGLQILVSLQILRSASFQNNVGDDEMFHMSQASLSRSFDSFLDAIMDISPTFIEFPSMSELAFTEPKLYEQSKIPNIMGIVDCFSVYISRPKTPIADVYTTKRSKYSLNVQLVCDSDLRVLDTAVHWPGDTPNSETWKNCALRTVLKENAMLSNSFLVGNSSFPLEPWLLVPYEECHKTEELVFNDHISRALNVGKKCYATLKTRFKCLNHNSRPLYYSPEKSSKIIITCMVLHNIGIKLNQDLNELIDFNEDSYCSSDYSDVDSNIEENLLRNEGMSIRDDIARQLLSL